MLKNKLLLSLISLFAISTVAFAYNYDTNLPLPGKSLANVELQGETLFPVYSYTLRVATPECKDFSVINTEVSKQKKDNSWEEIWTVKACSVTARIPITFTENDGKAFYAIDPINVKVTK